MRPPLAMWGPYRFTTQVLGAIGAGLIAYLLLHWPWWAIVISIAVGWLVLGGLVGGAVAGLIERARR
jgi:hypothetical protein